jgi:hypothetical protein
MLNLLEIQSWGIGMGWGVALILAVLVIIVGIYYYVRKK